ncbi:hypothetical protein [Pelagicoccus albus]|uniref:VPLPA-CTERM protein sorting domain-containing protein n=1 Tax=Pelagicoccus albus TaxID=415222 RepID=A0A7X1E6S6_9BACT|nr:hypothetical protein [Pelagicoccus albus]MBC2604446.1 hypothetical protein [Pelagicoccus albus]
MKSIKTLFAAAAALAITAVGFSIETPFSVTYSFDTNTTPVVDDVSGALTADDATGGTVNLDVLFAPVDEFNPAVFDFGLGLTDPANFSMSVAEVAYTIIFKSTSLGLTSDNSILIPGTAVPFTLSVGLTGLESYAYQLAVVSRGVGTAILTELSITGTITGPDTPVETVPDSSVSLLGLFAIVGLVAASKRLRK